jgi:MFS family permease
MAMFGNYYVYDSISPLADLLSSQLGFKDSAIGLLQGIYSIPNIFMVLIGGLIIDRIGTKKVSMIFSGLCMLGAFFTAIKGDLVWMATGRLIFGLGAESLIVAITTILARWFKGKELSFAFGLNLTIARLGSFAALNSATWGKSFYESWQGPLWVAFMAGLVSVIAVIIYFVTDTLAGKRYNLAKEGNQDKIVLKDVLKFNKSFWFITMLCVTFYSAMFPFQTFAVKFFINQHFTQIPTGVGRSIGGFLSSLLTLSAMILTPIFGLLADKIGKRATLMMFGSLLIIPVYLIMNYTHTDRTIPDDLLEAIFAKKEIVREYCNEKNEAILNIIDKSQKIVEENKSLDELLNDYKSEQIAIVKSSLMNFNNSLVGLENAKLALLEESHQSIEKLIDSLELRNRVEVLLLDNKLIFKDNESIGLTGLVTYYLNMLRLLFTYFPFLLFPMILMGIAFSLIPAVMWPSVALITEQSKLGTAYGMMTMIQNIGLSLFNLLIGSINDLTGSYTMGMWIFSILGFLGFTFGFLLKRADSTKGGFGLELSAKKKKLANEK